ncbi:MAG: peptide deformylase [Gammaproteobacteria bacterium]
MAVREVLKIGNPFLLQVADSVTEFDVPALHHLVTDMFDTMKAQSGAGLAAPQIGVSLRVMIFGFESNPRYPDVDAIPVTVLINPGIEILDSEMADGWEGCLSVPGMRGLVPRYTKIRYTGYDQYGKEISRSVEGFHARVVQHEFDHLDGILYPQRMRDMRQFGYEDELFPDNKQE